MHVLVPTMDLFYFFSDRFKIHSLSVKPEFYYERFLSWINLFKYVEECHLVRFNYKVCAKVGFESNLFVINQFAVV